MMIHTPLIRIVDDDETFLDSQKMLLETLGWEVKTYTRARAFLEDETLTRPGCVLLDVRMPEMTGLEVQAELEKRKSTLPIIFLSAHGDIAMAVHTMRHGAVDFLEKPVETEVLLQRVSTSIATSLRNSAEMEETRLIKERVAKLSGREKDVAKLVAHGLRNKEIARKLGIEETTVKMHRANALAKLAATSSAELTRLFTIIELKEH